MNSCRRIISFDMAMLVTGLVFHLKTCCMKTCCMLLFMLLGVLEITNRGMDMPLDTKLPATGDSLPDRTLIINGVDVNAMKIRKNKKELFYELADTLKYLVKSTMQQYTLRVIDMEDRPLVTVGTYDTSVYLLLRQRNAAYAVVIKDLDVHFEQRNVEVTKDEAGTHRNANYDIYSVVQYDYYDTVHLVKSAVVTVFHHFSTRSVISGFFAAGPDITSNREAAFAMLRENAAEYFRSFFPWQLFPGK